MENIHFFCSHGNLYTKVMQLCDWGVLCMTMLFEKSRKKEEVVFLWKFEHESNLLVFRLELPGRFLFPTLVVIVGWLSMKLKLDRNGLNLMRGFRRQRTGHGEGCEQRKVSPSSSKEVGMEFSQSEAHARLSAVLGSCHGLCRTWHFNFSRFHIVLKRAVSSKENHNKISYSKRARGTSANKEFGLRRDSGLWRDILFLSLPSPSTLKLLVSAPFLSNHSFLSPSLLSLFRSLLIFYPVAK
jgi:hypothetical protein